MRRFRKLPEEVRRQQILDAALHAFSQDGYARVSMARIAKDAGLTKGGLYFHYASKEEVFSAMVEQELEHRWEIAEQMAAKIVDLPPLEVVQRVLQRWFALDDRPDLLTPTVIATCIEMERPREAFRRQVERVTGLIAGVLEPVVEQLGLGMEPREVAELLMVFRVGVIWKETTASRDELERFRTMITGTLGRLLTTLAPAGVAR
jgi:AcrR family transcriptional regulator